MIMGHNYLIILDCLRKDFSEGMFPGLESCPGAVANFSWSLPSHNAILTDKDAEDVETFSSNSKVEDDTIASEFSDASYRTVSISSNGFFQPNFGFDDFDKHVNIGNRVPFNPELFEELRHGGDGFWDSARDILKRSVRRPSLLFDAVVYLYKTRKPDVFGDSGLKKILGTMSSEKSGQDHFFAVNIMEMHTSRTPPLIWCLRNGYVDLIWKEFLYKVNDRDSPNEVEKESEAEFHRRAYTAARDYTGDLLRNWLDENLEDEDTVVITSDHGELLGEYGLISHCYGFTPEQFHVPLFYRGPVDLPDFLSLDDLYDVLTAGILEDVEVDINDKAFFYSSPGSDIDGRWAEDQKGMVNQDFRAVKFEEKDDEEVFFKPFENEEIERSEPVSIPDFRSKENYNPEEEVKQRLEKLGYMNK
jgi:arylsulfatase